MGRRGVGHSDYADRRENPNKAAIGYVHYKDGTILPMTFRKDRL